MSIDGFSHSDDSTSVSSLNANVILDVVKDNRNKRRLSNSGVVIQTLRSVIWFPVAPIVCLGFNTAYSIVWYHTKKENNVIFVVDKVLQFLAIPLIAMTFYLSPPVKRAYKQWRLDRKTGNGNGFHRFEEHKMQKRHGAEDRRKRKSQLVLRSRSQQSIDLDHDGRGLRHRHRTASLPSSLPPSPVYRSQSPSPETSTLTSRSNSLFYYQDDIN
ncbi:hypothetical protein IWW45_004544 [Coemansia sp. RSA 485]|nr:hypothetical protein IWW45_004544 [Coemansia sp. RSA 485]